MNDYEFMIKDDKDFELLEKIFTKCSQFIVQCVINRQDKKINGNAEFKNNMLEKLRGCYERSYFLNSVFTGSEIKQKQKYTDYVMKNFEKAIEKIRRACKDQKQFDIILPFLFFSLVVQNESNIETVSRRRRALNQELKKNNCNFECEIKALKSEWRHKDPFSLQNSEIYTNYKNCASYIRKSKEVVDLFYNKEFDNNNLVSDLAQYLAQTFQFMDEAYESLVKCSEYAKIGSFLSDILNLTYNIFEPLDTILAMYMIVHPPIIENQTLEEKKEQNGNLNNTKYRDVFGWTRYIIENTGDNTLLIYERELLTYYLKVSYNDEFLQKSGVNSIYYKNILSRSELDRLCEKTIIPAQYDDLYQCIYRNYHFSTKNFLNFYLNKKILDLYVGADKHMTDYAGRMKKLIEVASAVDSAMLKHEIVRSLRKLFAREVKEEDTELTQILIERRREKLENLQENVTLANFSESFENQ